MRWLNSVLASTRRQLKVLRGIQNHVEMDVDDAADDYDAAILRGDVEMDISAGGEVPLSAPPEPQDLNEMYAAYLLKRGYVLIFDRLTS